MIGKIVITNTSGNFKDYDTASYKIVYNKDVDKGSNPEDIKRIKIQNLSQLKQIEKSTISRRLAVNQELKNKISRHNLSSFKVIGDEEAENETYTPASFKYKKKHEKIMKDLEEDMALKSANLFVKQKVQEYNKSFNRKFSKNSDRIHHSAIHEDQNTL